MELGWREPMGAGGPGSLGVGDGPVRQCCSVLQASQEPAKTCETPNVK